MEKGTKMYAAYNPESKLIFSVRNSIEEAQKSLDSGYTMVIEFEVTKLFRTKLEPIED